MRDDVLIVLNEREPLKRQKAAELEEQCTLRNLSAYRLLPEKNLLELIKERAPRVLVLDYLLGDYGTALDILQGLSERHNEVPICTLVWTDEPSISVAVTALKLGADDYVEMTARQSVEKIVQNAASYIETERARERLRSRKASAPKFRTLIYQDPAARACLAHAHSAAAREAPVVVIHGPAGIGRNALGRMIHELRPEAGLYAELEWDLWPGALEELFGDPLNRRIVPLLSNFATVLIDHVEFESSELLEATATHAARIAESGCMLIIGTTNEEIADAWQRVTDAERIDVPALGERPHDFLPLLQQILLEAASISGAHELKLTPELLEMLGRHRWPGNIRQLRAAVLDALATPLPLLAGGSPSDAEGGAVDVQDALQHAIRDAAERWERHHQREADLPDPLKARTMLDASLGNLRVAAARLGIAIPELRSMLGMEVPHGR